MEVRATRRATVAPSVSTLLCGNEEIQKMHRRQQLPQTEPALLKTNVKFLRRISHDLLVPVICHRLCITVGTAAFVMENHRIAEICRKEKHSFSTALYTFNQKYELPIHPQFCARSVFSCGLSFTPTASFCADRDCSSSRPNLDCFW